MPSRFFTVTKFGSLTLWRLFRKYYYWIIFAIIILPIIFTTIQTSIEAGNPSLPFLKLGLYLTNADSLIYDNVEILESDPTSMIGMAKPTQGIWNNLVYYWHVFKNVIWKLFGLVWLIALPFVLIYRIIRMRQTSEPAKNILKTLWWGFLFIFIINLIMTIYYLINGSIIYHFPEDANLEYKTWIVVLTTLPFHGIINLVTYLFSLL